jgi:hypothetical protein
MMSFSRRVVALGAVLGGLVLVESGPSASVVSAAPVEANCEWFGDCRSPSIRETEMILTCNGDANKKCVTPVEKQRLARRN